ncbi:hypothetical protein M569_11172, partial [Genlisea aurea]
KVQRHLQLRIEAQGKYMQSILEKACQTLAGDNIPAAAAAAATGGGYNKSAIGEMASLNPTMNFQTLQDLNMYSSSNQLDHHHHHHQFHHPPQDNFSAGNQTFSGKKRPNPYLNNSHSAGKNPLVWPEDLRLRE